MSFFHYMYKSEHRIYFTYTYKHMPTTGIIIFAEGLFKFTVAKIQNSAVNHLIIQGPSLTTTTPQLINALPRY